MATRKIQKPIKITGTLQSKLQKLKKGDLVKLAKLAGEDVDATKTKSVIAHQLTRNKQIALAIFLGIGASGILGRWFGKKIQVSQTIAAVFKERVEKLIEDEDMGDEKQWLVDQTKKWSTTRKKKFLQETKGNQISQLGDLYKEKLGQKK